MFLDFLFPKMCVGCGKSGEYLCDKCFLDLQRVNMICPYCRQYSYKGRIHKKCDVRLGLDGLIVYWKYTGNMRKILLKLKYNFSYDMASFLAEKINIELEERKSEFEDAIFVPVPLHQKRERWRGFNQEKEVCKKLCELNNWKMEDLLVRKKETKIQAKLKGKERKENVKDVFELNPYIGSETSSVLRTAARNALATGEISSLDISDSKTSLITLKSKLSAHNIVIFDDVWTSGSTIRECCETLKKAGAKEVWGMCLAR